MVGLPNQLGAIATTLLFYELGDYDKREQALNRLVQLLADEPNLVGVSQKLSHWCRIPTRK
ncbi:MAG: hypothetical protein F6K30_29875 [Cyanothece sp. SIO2G6]|nr:hypothetical protein [Cyanothece sp. SIO2G6]